MKKNKANYLAVCKKHDCIIYHESNKECNLCVANTTIIRLMEKNEILQDNYEVLEEKYNTALANAPGSF